MQIHLIIAAVAAALGAAVLVMRADLRRLLSTIGPKWANLHPDVQTRALEVLAIANDHFRDQGLRVGIFDGWRPESDQTKHIESGVSFVSSARRSYHVWGLAVDFVFIDAAGNWTWLPNPNNPADRGYRDSRWFELGAIIEGAGFEWGGRWSQFDGPHAQLPVRRTATLIAEHPGGFEQWQSSWA